uniref:Ubiquitin-like domain-containing protein n=1 Tax=Oncorhynchus kisutch TaxID=8019 RepID=A0A8C7JT62_ONCKI
MVNIDICLGGTPSITAPSVLSPLSLIVWDTQLRLLVFPIFFLWQDYFHVQLYAGAILRDSWVLTDVGITPSSAICCLLKREPVVRVFSAVTGETLSVSGTVFLLSTSVARLMTLVSQQCGLPVSSFRLSSPTGLQLYDCNRLHDYAIDLGATLRLDTWDGWAEFLRGCFLGHRLTVQRHLSRERPVMRSEYTSTH